MAVLDLYAGSGALGFEAASRNARHVTLVERDPVTVRALESARETLQARQVEVVRADALEFLQRTRTQYDVIFLDPPFADAPWPALLERLPGHVAPNGLVYCESGIVLQPSPDWVVHRAGRAGQVNYALLKRTGAAPKTGEAAAGTANGRRGASQENGSNT